MSKKRYLPSRISGGVGPYQGKVRIDRTLTEYIKVGTRTVRKRTVRTSNGEIKYKKEDHFWGFSPEDVFQLASSCERKHQGALGYSDPKDQDDDDYYLDEDED